MSKLEEQMRSEQDSQHLMLERDRLAAILQWYAQGISHLQAGLQAQIESYNQLVAQHVAERDKKEAVNTGTPSPT